MCGIAGLINENKTEYQPILQQMVDCMRYRGPDETGYYSDADIGLGHARLNIMDPDNGQQPTANEDGSVMVVFNGEIYNFLSLREALLNKGHILSNNSDTAVLPHLYEDYGIGMFEMLNGQFSIAIWDKRIKRLILARDRFGEKPLFYFHQGRNFCFASEAKALFKSGLVSATLSPTALKHVFAYWTTSGEESVFQDIYQVPTGSYLLFENGETKIKAYWKYAFTAAPPLSVNQDEYICELENRLLSSVRNRMISDVPISFYLSGGLDSSLVSAMAAQISGRRLNTFSITFDDEAFDESVYQEYMSQYLGTNHHKVMFSRNQIPSIIREVIWHTEVPLLRSGAFPMYVLAKLVRSNGIKVVLSGEGSDELFGGYDIFREVKIREFCARNPESKYRTALYKRVNNFVKGLPDQSNGSLSLYYNSADPHSSLSSHLSRWRMGAYSRQFFSPEYREAMQSHDELKYMQDALPQKFSTWTPIQRSQYLEVITLFSNYLLSSQGDRVSMGNSVECRYPFLDYEVVDFAAALPDSLKIKGLNEKFIVKKLAKKYVPEMITKRSKFPYRAPINISELLKDEYIEYVMSGSSIKQYGVFNAEAISRFRASVSLKNEPTERDCMLFMGILTTQILCEQFIK